VKKFSIFFFIGVVSMLAAGCGYHRAQLNNPLLANVHTMAIPYFKNKTFEPEAEKIFTNAFMNEFIESRKLQMVGPNEADVILYGTVRSLREETIGYNKDDKSLDNIVQMVVDVQLEERATGKVLWKRKGMRHGEDYPIATQDVQASEAARRLAMQKIAADLAERVHDSIMMGF
jgi:hypothetical protein